MLEDASYDAKILKRVNKLWRVLHSEEFAEDNTDYYRKRSFKLKSETREPKLERSQLWLLGAPSSPGLRTQSMPPVGSPTTGSQCRAGSSTR